MINNIRWHFCKDGDLVPNVVQKSSQVKQYGFRGGQKRMKKRTISQLDKPAYQLFVDALPYYWDTWNSLPAGLRFSLMINGYGSAAMACVDIANHWLSSPKLARQAQKQLVHMQAWKGNEP